MINESFVIAFATLLFVLVAFKPAKAFILNVIDEHTREAVKNLHESENMYQQSKVMFEEMQKQYEEAKKTAEAIIEKAKEEADNLISEAAKEVDKITRKKSEMAVARISQQEQNITDYLKDTIITEALERVQTMIANQDKNFQLALIKTDLEELAKKKSAFNKK